MTSILRRSVAVVLAAGSVGLAAVFAFHSSPEFVAVQPLPSAPVPDNGQQRDIPSQQTAIKRFLEEFAKIRSLPFH